MSITRHSLAVRQEVCAMMALNMLRRWLNRKEVASEHGWINVVESLFVEESVPGRVPGNGYASAFASKVMGCSQRLLVDISICHLQVSQSVTTISAPLSSICRNSGAPMACEVG